MRKTSLSVAFRILPLLGCLIVAACSIPIPQAEADPTRFYVLSTSTVPPATPPAAGAPVIHLRQVELANYLRARPIIVRRGDNEIQFREFARWGEPLEQGIARVLREELIARGAGAVLAPGLRAASVNHERELAVRVLAFEGGADGSVNFRAVWELSTTGANSAPAARGDFRPADLRWDATNEATLAAQLSNAIAGLAAEISRALAK